MFSQQHLSFIYVDLFSSLLFEHRGDETCGQYISWNPHSKCPVSKSVFFRRLTEAFFVIVKQGMRGQQEGDTGKDEVLEIFSGSCYSIFWFWGMLDSQVLDFSFVNINILGSTTQIKHFLNIILFHQTPDIEHFSVNSHLYVFIQSKKQ